MPKKLNTKNNKEFCETLFAEFIPRLTTTEEYVSEDVKETLEETRGTDKWRVHAHWFGPYTDPTSQGTPLLEVHVTRIRNNKTITSAFLYKVGTGNDAYPKWQNSGWVVEIV